jgi:glycosyltransferase involved in cell wall biosynthesis
VTLAGSEDYSRLRLDTYDAVLAQALAPRDAFRLARSRTRVVYDLYIPAFAEALASPLGASAVGRAGVLAQEIALATGDAFVCASERQRDLLLGMLADLDRLDPDLYAQDASLRNLIDVVPFGVSEEPPPAWTPRVPEAPRTLLWAGGIADWLDPLTPIRALGGIPNARLVFLSRHPETQMSRRAQALARQLDAPVEFGDAWVPYDQRGAHLAAADLGVSAHFDTLEARFAFRTRLLDHFWTGLATVTTRGDVLADLIEERGLGRAVPAGDAEAYAAAANELLDAPPPPDRFQPVREELAWRRVVEPLRRLLERKGPPPAPAPFAARLRLRGTRTALALRERLG